MVTPQTILANIGMHMNEVGNIVQNIQKQCTVCAVSRMPGKLMLILNHLKKIGKSYRQNSGEKWSV